MSDTNRHIVNYEAQPEIRPPSRVSPVAAVVLVIALGLVALYWIGSIAFTPAGMQRFQAGLAGHVQWLTGSANGQRVSAFAMFALAVGGVIAFVRHTILKNFGSAVFGYGEAALGVALLCGAIGEWHLGQIGILLMLGLCWGGYILIVFGWRNIQANQGAQFAPQLFQQQELPAQTIYGDARELTSDEEIEKAMRGRTRVNNGGYRYEE